MLSSHRRYSHLQNTMETRRTRCSLNPNQTFIDLTKLRQNFIPMSSWHSLKPTSFLNSGWGLAQWTRHFCPALPSARLLASACTRIPTLPHTRQPHFRSEAVANVPGTYSEHDSKMQFETKKGYHVILF